MRSRRNRCISVSVQNSSSDCESSEPGNAFRRCLTKSLLHAMKYRLRRARSCLICIGASVLSGRGFVWSICATYHGLHDQYGIVLIGQVGYERDSCETSRKRLVEERTFARHKLTATEDLQM